MKWIVVALVLLIAALLWFCLDLNAALTALRRDVRDLQNRQPPTRCTDCGKPLSSYEETESGLCLRCLNGPVPGGKHAHRTG